MPGVPSPGAQEKRGGGKVGLRQDLSSRSPAGVNGLTPVQRVREPRPGRMLHCARRAAPDACCVAPGGVPPKRRPGASLAHVKNKRGNVVSRRASATGKRKVKPLGQPARNSLATSKAALQKTLQVG